MFWPDAEDAVAPTGDPAATAGVTPSTPSSPLPTAPATSDVPSETPEPSATPSETSSLLPGTLSVSTRTVDLGRTQSSGSLGIANTGDLPVLYQVSSRTPWLSVSPIGGRLSGQGGRRIDLRVDRSAVPEGRSTGSVVLNWDGGRVLVAVRLTEERGPVVGAPSVPAGSSCTVPVTVRASDESGVKGVTLAWTGPTGPGIATMSRSSDGSWSTDVDVPIGGSYTFRASATDSRGNTTTGPATTVDLDPCPQ
jgi:hypothetical protein